MTTILLFISFFLLNLNDLRSEIGFTQYLNRSLPLELTFHNELGKKILLQNYFLPQQKKPVILVFSYNSCSSLCHHVLNQVQQATLKLPLTLSKDFIILNISIDPQESFSISARKKKKYLDYYNQVRKIKTGHNLSGWNFLSASEPTIKKITTVAGFNYQYDQETKEYRHPSGMMIITPEGKISRYFLGLQYEERDLHLSLIEASRFKIGQLKENLILLCSSFDPTVGKYSLTIKGLLKFLAALTVLILLFFLIISLLQDLRHKERENV